MYYIQTYVQSLAVSIIIGNQLRQWTAATLVSCGSAAPVLIESMRSQCCSCPMGGSSGQPSNPVRPRIQEGLKLTLLITHNHNPQPSAFLEDNYPAYYPAQLFAVHSTQNKTSIYFNSHNQRNSTRTPDALDTSHTPGVSDMADSPNAPCLCI